MSHDTPNKQTTADTKKHIQHIAPKKHNSKQQQPTYDTVLPNTNHVELVTRCHLHTHTHTHTHTHPHTRTHAHTHTQKTTSTVLQTQTTRPCAQQTRVMNDTCICCLFCSSSASNFMCCFVVLLAMRVCGWGVLNAFFCLLVTSSVH